MNARDVMIALRGVKLRRGERAVLDDIDLVVARGEHVALIGPSGSGKSTLLRLLLGLEAPDAGDIDIAGGLASSSGTIVVPAHARNLGMVFQDLALWPHLSAFENVAFALECRAFDRDERVRRTRRILEDVGLHDLGHRYPSALSGGERQRLALARAVVGEPSALLFDEALSNLDVETKSEMIDLLLTTVRARSLTTIYVTHDPREAFKLAERMIVLEGGRITQSGPARALAEDSQSSFVRAFSAEWRGHESQSRVE